MKNQKIDRMGIWLIVGITILASCNSNPNKPGSSQTNNGNEKEAAATSPGTQSTATLSRSLNILWIEASDFSQLPNGKRLFLKYFIGDSDTLTLHGWSTNTNRFDTNPNIRLKNAGQSFFTFPIDKNYLGNYVIQNTDIKKVQDLIRKNTAYDNVLFLPMKSGDLIIYNIYLSDKRPQEIKDFEKIEKFENVSGLLDTETLFNPSPPRPLD